MNIFENELIKERNDKPQIGIADVLDDFIISLDEYFRASDRTKIPIGYDREINILTDNTNAIRTAFENGRVPNPGQLEIIREVSEMDLTSITSLPNTFNDAITIGKNTINSKSDLHESYRLCKSSIDYLIDNNLMNKYKHQYAELYKLRTKYNTLEDSIKNIYNICKEFNYD